MRRPDYFLLSQVNLRLCNVTASDELMDWWCPKCGEPMEKPVSFFLSTPCLCPYCASEMDMRVLRKTLTAFEKAKS
ncbi:MAG: hypothetical protein DLM73_07865 [Chthoniobacterales bacterium]|nr:MAG: hypothetical protein DLM73_07865 [Chthoniobacterales bacterium]